MEGINWPLTNVPLNRLPRFLNGDKDMHVNRITPVVANPVRNISGSIITGPIPKPNSRVASIRSSDIPSNRTQHPRTYISGGKKPPAPKPPPR
jgi:hypothetical protein